jgi:hypothetical protein
MVDCMASRPPEQVIEAIREINRTLANMACSDYPALKIYSGIVRDDCDRLLASLGLSDIAETIMLYGLTGQPDTVGILNV